MLQFFVGTCLFAEITSSVLWIRRSPLAPFNKNIFGTRARSTLPDDLHYLDAFNPQTEMVALEMSNMRHPLLCSVLMLRVYVVVRHSIK